MVPPGYLLSKCFLCQAGNAVCIEAREQCSMLSPYNDALCSALPLHLSDAVRSKVGEVSRGSIFGHRKGRQLTKGYKSRF